MIRFLSLLLVVIIVSVTSFSDWNGNGQMDEGESYAAGSFMLHVTAADGAVSLTVVDSSAGQPYQLELHDGDRVEALSGCGSWTVDVTQPAVHVPVICRAVFMPVVMADETTAEARRE